ncbi:MAG TPA: helix-turn-helix domain-containing protein [Rhizomicrobium sp.]|nr:helix-turn-helix domain-containing protein [Rhizomicrobium sp.]
MTKLTQMSLENDGVGDKDGLNRRRIHLREISGDSESPLESVGQDLRAARLRRGDEIAAVSRALKIRKDHLEALENDRIEDLPGKTYAIGFVRSYARHLGLDSAQFVERYKQDISGRAEEQVREPAPIHQDEGRRLPQGWRLIAGAVGILLVWGAYHLLFSGGDSNQAVPPAPVLNPPKQIARVAPAPAPMAAPVQTATPSPAADAAPPAAATSQQASATPPPAAGAKTPATALSAGAPPTASLTAQAAVPAVGAGQVYGGLNRNPRVILRARSDTRVTVRGPDNQFLLNRDLKAGDSYQVPDMPGVTMATSNAGAVEMDLDGIALGRAGAPQQVLGRVSLDPQSLADRFNNH